MINPEHFIAGLRRELNDFRSRLRQPARLPREEQAAYEPMEDLTIFDMGPSGGPRQNGHRQQPASDKWG